MLICCPPDWPDTLNRNSEVTTVKKVSVAAAAILIMAVTAAMGCNMAQAAKTGDKVQVNYTGRFSDGQVFDSSAGLAPLEFTIGEGKVIPGFDKAVLGMRVGEKKTVTIPAADAYGPHSDKMMIEVPLAKFPSDITPEVGLELESPQKDGSTIVARITKITDKAITLDANHPLAGKDLTFDIELVKILTP
jgi:peptidylprolyl isomerase